MILTMNDSQHRAIAINATTTSFSFFEKCTKWIIYILMKHSETGQAGRKYIHIRDGRSAYLIYVRVARSANPPANSLDDNVHCDRFILEYIIYHAHVILWKLFVISISRSTIITSKTLWFVFIWWQILRENYFLSREIFVQKNIVSIGERKSRISLFGRKKSKLSNTLLTIAFLKLFAVLNWKIFKFLLINTFFLSFFIIDNSITIEHFLPYLWRKLSLANTYM